MVRTRDLEAHFEFECKACEDGRCARADVEKILSERKGLREFYEAFREHIRECKRMTYGQYMFTIDREVLPEAVLWWHNHPEFKETHLSTAVGTDERPLNGHFVYMPFLNVQVEFANEPENYWVFLRAYLPADDPSFPSVAAKLPAALWIEREVKDLLGFNPVEHPDPRRLILPEDWPEGVYPLRKDMDYRNSPITEPKTEYRETPEGTTLVPMGPAHMGIEEPAHFRLFVKGEEIVDVDYRGFYSHRGIEKTGEGRLTYNQVLFLAERICGICGYQHSVSYAMAVERLADVEIPDRARYIRTLLLELERIHNHLLWVGIAAHFSSRRIGELSGGQRQRVLIARALVSDPKILMLDEPTASIDFLGQKEIYELLERLNERMTIILVSHDMSMVMGYAKHVLYVQRSAVMHTIDPHTRYQIRKELQAREGHYCPADFWRDMGAKIECDESCRHA